MTPVTRMITVYLLALTLVVLPFSTSFGFFMTGANYSMQMGHVDSAGCNDSANDTSCLQLSDQEQHAETDDECCTDHCDAFSGAQICTDIIQETDIPFTDEYIATLSSRVTEQLPSQILRPPLHLP